MFEWLIVPDIFFSFSAPQKNEMYDAGNPC